MAKGKGGFLGQDGLNAPDNPTGVSATAGDAQATVSWTNPSSAGSTAITEYNVQSSTGEGSVVYPSYTLSGASYDNIDSPSLSSQIGQGQGLSFKTDGTKMYVSDQSNAYQYSLSTAWDITTASYDSKSLSLSSADDPNNTFFKTDGTKFYVVSKNNSYINEYDISTAWDISTGPANYSRRFYMGSQGSNPSGVFFKSDGTKMYVLSNSADTVYQYSLSTAWNVTTASYDSKSFTTTTQAPNPRSIQLSDDGKKLFVADANNDYVYQYDLAPAYDISTASYSNYSLNVASQDGFPYAIAFKSDGVKLYMLGATSDKVHQYSTGVEEGGLITSPVVIDGLTNNVSYTFNVLAKNASGWSTPSDPSDAVTPSVQGQQEYTTPGSYSWTAPTGVTSVSVVVVGGGGGGMWSSYNSGTGQYGGGGGGGALRYANNVSVTPGSSYTVVVGAKGDGAPSPTDGGQSYFNSTGTVQASGGPKGSTATQTSAATGSNGDGGGSGGKGAYAAFSGGGYGGGGGAAGYSGNGGDAQYNGGPGHQSGAGGGGGGGFGSGGGVGLQGQGSNGGFSWSYGNGGSGGSDGGNYYPPSNPATSNGGAYGGGGGCQDNTSGAVNGMADGGSGAVRIIWPGGSRQFPSTNTADV